MEDGADCFCVYDRNVNCAVETRPAVEEQFIRESLSRRYDPLARRAPRQVEVLSLMTEGRTNQGVAAGLHLAVASVEKHTASFLQKLGLDDSGTAQLKVLTVLSWLRRDTLG